MRSVHKNMIKVGQILRQPGVESLGNSFPGDNLNPDLLQLLRVGLVREKIGAHKGNAVAHCDHLF